MDNIIGKNVICYPAQNQQGYVEVKVILVEGVIGDYAAYAGCGDDLFVARQGNKISFKEANIHFCGRLEKEKYREIR
jgi:hypothetical protein